jgi:CRISPR system Cascade subunit CasC
MKRHLELKVKKLGENKMTKFVQIHTLVSYPPSNLNRDDLGRPKTAVMGGTQRLRVSSQSLKRAWRTSDIFKESLGNHIGVRTKSMGVNIFRALTTGVSLADVLNNNNDASPTNSIISEKEAKKWSKSIAGVFGKSKKDSDDSLVGLEIEQLAHFSLEEISAIDQLITKISSSGSDPSKDDLNLLRKEHTAVDIAMFGRMLASNTNFNTEASVQVSHAITANEVAVEDDFFTAVDDLNKGEEDMGSGHLGETEFASGLFYTYVCVDRELLENNLGGDKELTNKALYALVEAMAKVSPTGKQNSFASRAYASYMMIEKGNQQPRSLSVSYLEPVKGRSMLKNAIDSLKQTNEKMKQVYGDCCEKSLDMNVYTGEGSLEEMLNFVSS